MKSASFIFSALMASASAIELSTATTTDYHLELHADGKNAGMFMIGNGKVSIFVDEFSTYWKSGAHVFDLEAELQA